MRSAHHQPGLQVQRVEQAHRPFAVHAGPVGDLAQRRGLAAQAQVRYAQIDDELTAALVRWEELGSR